MIGDRMARQDQVQGKVMLIIGLGDIGKRVAKLAQAFEMKVLAIRKSVNKDEGLVKSVYGISHLPKLLSDADFVVLTCPSNSN